MDAARLLPCVDEVLVQHVPWIDATPEPVDRAGTEAFVDRLAELRIDQAFVLTSFHQSPLPMALLLRLAGVPCIAAISVDYPGSLLDVRHRVPANIHEVERALSLVGTLGYRLPPGDTGALAVRTPASAPLPPGVRPPYVVVHPGTSVSARAWAPASHAELVRLLTEAGRRVVVTGAPDETALTAEVAGASRTQAAAAAEAAGAGRGKMAGAGRTNGRPRDVVDLGGRTDLAGLAAVLRAADAVVVGNTGPAHLAAAVGTPVVSLFAPTVPAARWRPWGTPQVLLGDQAVACAGCRATRCPVPGHPCLSSVTAQEVVAALQRLAPRRARSAAGDAGTRPERPAPAPPNGGRRSAASTSTITT
jgi:ADP-heptose:LPS heptosyltransferase